MGNELTEFMFQLTQDEWGNLRPLTILLNSQKKPRRFGLIPGFKPKIIPHEGYRELFHAEAPRRRNAEKDNQDERK